MSKQDNKICRQCRFFGKSCQNPEIKGSAYAKSRTVSCREFVALHRLAKWRKAHKVSRKIFGAMLPQNVHEETIRRYEVEGRVPEADIVCDIYVLTRGYVKPQHFYDLPELD